MHCNVIPAFPSPVIQVMVDDDTSELLEHDEYNVSIEQADNYEHSGSNESVLEKYPKTKNILLDAFTTVAEEVLGYKKRNYAITTSWITRTNRGEGSQIHRHKNSFWSCVYYYQKEYIEGTGQILFENPNTEKFDFYFSHNDMEKINNINSLVYVIPPQPTLASVISEPFILRALVGSTKISSLPSLLVIATLSFNSTTLFLSI